MSIYKSAKTGRYWQYDFQHRGRRFYGSTGQVERRRAQRVEDDLKLKAKLGTLGSADELTLDVAVERWWQEAGQHLAKADSLERELGRVVGLVGPQLLLTEITTARVQTAIQKRRAIKTRHGRLPAPATVNREIIANLRRILRHAEDVWELQGIPRVAWRKLRLAEPKPRIREFTAAEILALQAALPLHWQDLAHFLGRYGVRLGEAFFDLDDLDLEGQRLTLRGRKADDEHQLPLLAADVTWLAARVGRARAAKLRTVWFRELKGGRLKALTYNAALQALHNGLRDAGLKASKGARVHDLRHHAGTQILRASKNLKVAQRLLGHASIASTVRYAHALDEDLRGGLEAVEAALNPKPAADPPPAEDQVDERKTA